MRKLNSDQIRQMWLDFFKEKGHYEEPSASLIPQNDPTLLWINAGVAALKKYFDGSVTPEHRRIVNAQKSLRTNDIENVGRTSRHHTFFEMLGNFSIGDYFRSEVIPWAFELLTSEKWFGFDKNKLYISYYPNDVETRDLWVKCGMSEDHLIPCYENFWEIGEGPCGPDTEIHYDRGEEYDPNHLGTKLIAEDIDNNRFIEIWNIVFSQFNAKSGLKREEYPLLPSKNIDTGCSLERLACIMQGVETNFETDYFMPIIKAIENECKYKYEGEYKFYYRVIADHIRSLVFTLSDGASFSNEGRGYVLRRLLRRASKYAHTLELKVGFLSNLVDVVVNAMKTYYPYLIEKKDRVKKMIANEESKFSKTLINGEKLLRQAIKDEPSDTISGDVAFKLSDTYGFPIELTEEICLQNNKKVDLNKYKELLQKQKETARNSRNTIESFSSQNEELMNFDTESVYTYDLKDINSTVIALFENGKRVDELTEEGFVVFEKTNFYAESGGQIADTGFITNRKCEAEVLDCKKAPHKQHMLYVKVNYGTIKVGDKFKQCPDFEKRKLTMKNHSACHLLQATLQKYVDSEIKQQGSFVSNDVMRFDFSLDRKMSNDEINTVERVINEKIAESIDSKIEILSKEDALKTNSMHLFEEKYGDKVRVVSFGDYSSEFCAGCHVKNTKDIGLFVIVSEQAISSGVRRITAYTGIKAYNFLKEKDLLLEEISKKLSLLSYKEIIKKLDQLNVEQSEMKKKINQLESKLTSITKNNVQSEEINGFLLKVQETEDFSHNQIVDFVSSLRSEDNSVILVLNKNNASGKADVCIALGKESVNKLKAGLLVKEVSAILGGSGGGRPDMAFGGVTSLEKKQEAIDHLKGILSK